MLPFFRDALVACFRLGFGQLDLLRSQHICFNTSFASCTLPVGFAQNFDASAMLIFLIPTRGFSAFPLPFI